MFVSVLDSVDFSISAIDTNAGRTGCDSIYLLLGDCIVKKLSISSQFLKKQSFIILIFSFA